MYIIDVADVQADIDRAADVLDELKPDWVTILVSRYGRDLADMKVSEPTDCVLSVLFSTYGNGDITVSSYMADNGIEDFDRHPFACSASENYVWREAWRRAIERRLS